MSQSNYYTEIPRLLSSNTVSVAPNSIVRLDTLTRTAGKTISSSIFVTTGLGTAFGNDPAIFNPIDNIATCFTNTNVRDQFTFLARNSNSTQSRTVQYKIIES